MLLDTLNPMRKNISGFSVDEIIWDWNIKNFTRLPERPGEFITSPHFTVGNNREIWALKFYPRGEFEDNIDYVSLYLQLVSAEKLGITVKFQLSMLKFDEVLQSKIINTKFANFLSVGCEKFASRSYLERSCQYDDSLVIACRIKVTSPGALKNRSLAFDGQKYQLCNDFGSLLSSHEFTDVVLIAEKRQFPAHKVVLSARSPVFAAMFKHKEMRENVENEVTIENIRPIVVKAMLEFIYRGEVAGIENLANDLLAAADRYELEDLRGVCEKILFQNLTIHNAIETLVTADLYRVTGLKECTLRYIKCHFSKVTRTPAFNEIQDVNLLREVMKLTSGEYQHDRTPKLSVGNWRLFFIFVLLTVCAYLYGRSYSSVFASSDEIAGEKSEQEHILEDVSNFFCDIWDYLIEFFRDILEKLGLISAPPPPPVRLSESIRDFLSFYVHVIGSIFSWLSNCFEFLETVTYVIYCLFSWFWNELNVILFGFSVVVGLYLLVTN